MFERLRRGIQKLAKVVVDAFATTGRVVKRSFQRAAQQLSDGLRRLLQTLERVFRRIIGAFQRLLGQLIPLPGGFAIVPAMVVLLWLGGCWPIGGGGGGFDPNPQPPALPPAKVTLRVGEQIDRNIWCREPVNQSPVMTIANAGTLANSAPAIASAALVDPNGNSGQGRPQTQGLVESPVIRITGLKPSPPQSRITLDISCPTLYFNTEGIGMARHRWLKATIIVTVIAPKGPNGGGQPGGPGQPGEEPTPGPDVPTGNTGDHGSMPEPTPEPQNDIPTEIVPPDLHGGTTCPNEPCAPDDGGCTVTDCGPSVCDTAGCKPEPTDCVCPEGEPVPPRHDDGFFDPGATPFDPVAR